MGGAHSPLMPGQRWLNRGLITYDLDQLNMARAEQALAQAPANLSGLTFAQLTALFTAWLTLAGCRRIHPFDGLDALGRRICAERAGRPEYRAIYGRP